MSNEKFRSLQIGDIVYVYDHGSKKHYQVQIVSMKGEHYDHSHPAFGNFKAVEIEFCSNPVFYSRKKERMDTGKFWVNFAEEKSRRGSAYTGFLTEEDAEEFRVYLLDMNINDLKKEIERLEKSK
jgi:hypothetical protein